MRNFLIDFNELSNSKQEEIRNEVRGDIELDLSALDKIVDSLTIEKMVDDVIRLTFNATASLDIDVEYLAEKYEEVTE